MTQAERAEFKDLIEEVLDDKITPRLNATTEKLADIGKKVFGNGNVEGSLCWEVEACKTRLAAVEVKLNQMLGTDNWRRELLLKAISSVFTGVLVLLIMMYFNK